MLRIPVDIGMRSKEPFIQFQRPHKTPSRMGLRAEEYRWPRTFWWVLADPCSWKQHIVRCTNMLDVSGTGFCEIAANSGNSRNLYEKIQSNWFTEVSVVIKKLSASLFHYQQLRLGHWTGHFKEQFGLLAPASETSHVGTNLQSKRTLRKSVSLKSDASATRKLFLLLQGCCLRFSIGVKKTWPLWGKEKNIEAQKNQREANPSKRITQH